MDDQSANNKGTTLPLPGKRRTHVVKDFVDSAESFTFYENPKAFKQYVDDHTAPVVIVAALRRNSRAHQAFLDGIEGAHVPVTTSGDSTQPLPIAVLLCDEEADDEDCTIPEYQVTAPAVASIEKSGGDSGTYISRLADDTITTEGVREFLTLAFVPPMIPFLDSNAWQEFIRANLGGEQRLAALIFDKSKVCDKSHPLASDLVEAARHVRGLALVLCCGDRSEAPESLASAFGVNEDDVPAAVVFDVASKAVFPLAMENTESSETWSPARVNAVSLRRHIEMAATGDLQLVEAWQPFGSHRTAAMPSQRVYKGMAAAHDGLWEKEAA